MILFFSQINSMVISCPNNLGGKTTCSVVKVTGNNWGLLVDWPNAPEQPKVTKGYL